MPGNYRYEEERSRGQRGTMRRGGYGGRGREEDDIEQRESERYDAGSRYGREGSSAIEDRYRGESEERDYGRSLGGRGAWERYDEGESYGSPYSAGSREERHGAGEPYGSQER